MQNSQNSDFKIALFTDTLCDANGVSRFIQDIGKEASTENKNLYIITSTVKHHCQEQSYIHNTKPVFRIKMPFYPELDLVFPNFFTLKKIAKELDVDIIHISTPGPVGICGLMISILLKKPRAGIYHTDFPSYIYDNTKSKMAKSITNFIMKLFYRNFKRVFSRSLEYVDIIEKDIGVKRDRIYTLHAGINTKSFHRDFRDLSIWENYENIKKESVKILYVGRLTNEKNFPFLLKIWEKLDSDYKSKAQFIVVGEGKYKNTPPNFSEQNIIYLGFRGGEELSRIYASSDIFIFPSITDTLGQVVMEAGSSGLPVIVSNIGGPQIVVNQNERKSGYILDCENIDDWLEELKKLIDSKELREELGGEGFKTIQGKSIESTFKDFWEENRKILP